FFADGDAENAELAHFFPQIHRELVAAVDFRGAGRDFRCSKLLHRFAQRGDVFAMIKGQAWQVQHVVLTEIDLRTGIIRRCDVNVNVKPAQAASRSPASAASVPVAPASMRRHWASWAATSASATSISARCCS